MGIASMVCGIVGLIGFIISGLRLGYLNDLKNKVGIIFQWQIQSQIETATVFVIISIILLILALIFGIIERKKGKSHKYYGMATAGFVLGLVGVILPVFLIIFVTGTTVITYGVMNKDKQSTVVDIESPYVGKRPEYSLYTDIGQITTKTRDAIDCSVTVDMIIGYDQNDQSASMELTSRQNELRDFVKRYFSGKYVSELQPENEERLKQDIKEILNTRFLDKAKVRIILFNKLDIIEVQ